MTETLISASITVLFFVLGYVFRKGYPFVDHISLDSIALSFFKIREYLLSRTNLPGVATIPTSIGLNVYIIII